MARAHIRPIRTTGALLVNPRPKRAKRKAPKVFLKNPKRRTSKRRRARRNPLAIRVNRRKYGALAIRVKRNGRHYGRKMRHNRRHRRNPLAIRVKRNGRHYGRRHRRNPASVKGVGKSLLGFLAPAGFGAIATEPLLMVADLVARYMPDLPSSLVYAASGAIAGTAIMLIPASLLSHDTKQKLAIGAASAGGAIGYYKWRTGQDAVVAAEMAGVQALGYSSPIALIAGPANYGAYEPTAVYPLRDGRYPIA